MFTDCIGDIVHTRILGDDVVVLSNETKLKVLTEGSRSAVYASRLHFPFFKRYAFFRSSSSTGNLGRCRFGVDFHTAMIPYGSEWRQHRSSESLLADNRILIDA